jgi:segregation and condensation protein B
VETLAIIAYRQPVTRAEIEQIRGVSSNWHIERLLERQLIRDVGRRQTIGRPVLFGTTEFFLRYFGLRDLSDLPPMGDRGVQTLLDAVR